MANKLVCGTQLALLLSVPSTSRHRDFELLAIPIQGFKTVKHFWPPL